MTNVDEKKINILVTGCGGDMGMNVGRVLKKVMLVRTLIGTDISTRHPGSLVFDVCESVMRADNPDFFIGLQNVVEKYSVDIIIPTSDAEIGAFTKNGHIREFADASVVLPNKKAIEVGLDKLSTADFLKDHELPYPWTKLVNTEPAELPCIVKPRSSQGSKDVFVVEEQFVKYYRKKYPKSVWQELLLPADQEYTCGLYRSQGREIRTIVFRRSLQGGFTGSGEVVAINAIETLLKDIALKLDLYGSINVQLRLTDQGPKIFEINPRFSSTTMFRHLLGFEDVVWSIEEVCGKNLSNYTPPTVGTNIFRGAHEYILPPHRN